MPISSHHDPNDDRATPSTEMEKQAWVWVRLLTSGEPKAWDVEGFRRWLRLDPAHRVVFNEVRRRWDEIRSPAATLHRDEADDIARIARRRPLAGRRAFLGAAAGAAAAAGVAVMYPPWGLWPSPDQLNADFRTATGEQRALALADRVDVVLNTRTSVRRRTTGGETTGLDLLEGEAAVDLRGNGRSFAVTAGRGSSTAQSGKFEVRSLDGRVCVSCLAGTVRLEHPAGSLSLQPRQQAIYDAHAVSGIASIEPAQVSAWRNGELLFDRTRLADVIAEINRYRAGQVVLMNPAMRNRLVNGRFAIASLDLALAQLQLTFGLKARSLPGSLVLLS